MKEEKKVGVFKNAGRGRPDFHKLHLLFQLFLEFQAISWPSTKTSQHIGSPLQTHDMLGKLLMSLCGPQAPAIISPSGFRVRMMERKKTIPQIAIKNHRNSGQLVSWCPLARILLPSPTLLALPSASQIKEVFFSMDFFISTRKLPQEQGGPDPKSHLQHRAKTIPFACYKCYCACVAEELVQHLHLCLDPPKLQPSQATFVAM